MRPCRRSPHPYTIFTFAILMVLLVSISPTLAYGATNEDVLSPLTTNATYEPSSPSAEDAASRPQSIIMGFGSNESPELQGERYAYNVEGRYSPLVIYDAATKQKSLNYIPITRERPPRSSIKQTLPKVGIFFFHGHGQPGRIQTSEESGEYYYARGDPDGYNIDSMSSLSNLKLALLLGCETGKTDQKYGNFVESVYAKDGECAMGFTKVISDPGTIYYSRQFWDAVASGATPLEAHEMAVAFVKDQFERDQCAGETKCDGTCCLDQMHHNGCIGGLKDRPEIIDLEQGRAIAEAYARVNNPDLFQESSTKELVFRSEVIDRGDDRLFKYVWDEYLYYPNKFTEPHVVIDGLNGTYITLSPYTGEIDSHSSSSQPLDPTLSLTSTLTEEQALEIAKGFAANQFYFTERGITPDPSEWESEGLRLYPVRETNTQHLAWIFDVKHRLAPDSYSIGGGVFVDAHDGTILGFNEIA